MSKIILFTSYLLVNSTFKDQLVRTFADISLASLPNEPGILKYGQMSPRDDQQGKALYTFEEYQNQEAVDNHLETPYMKDLFWWVNETKPYERQPIVTALAPIPGFEPVSKNEVNTQADPYIVVEEAEYADPALAELALAATKPVLAAALAENGTSLYGVFKVAGDPTTTTTRLFTIAAYDNATYLAEVHDRSPAAVELKARAAGVTARRLLLRRSGGFLHRRTAFQLRPDGTGVNMN